MKKKKFLTLLLILVAVTLVLCVSAKVFATEPDYNIEAGELARSGVEDGNDEINPISLPEGEGVPITTSDDEVDYDYDEHDDYGDIYEGDLYVFENKSYTMDQLVDGNVFIFCSQDVTITGQVNGAVYVCAGGTLTINEEAYIGSDLFALASNIELNGLIFDVYAAADKLNIQEGASIYRDIKAIANEMMLAGTVGRDANLTANKMTLSGEENSFAVYGDLNYQSKNEIADIDKALIQGEVKYAEYIEDDDDSNVVLDLVLSAISTIVFNVLIYIVLIFFAPKFVEKSKEYVSTRGILAFAIGIAFTIAVPVIALVLLMLNIGAASAAMLLIVYAAILMINAFVVAIAANEFIAEKIKIGDSKLKKGLLLIPVSLVLWAVRKIPFIGGWISIIVFMCGVGIVILYQFDRILNKGKSEVKAE